MNSKNKKQAYSSRFKFERVLETFKEGEVVQIARKYSLNANMISVWRKQFLDEVHKVYESGPDKELANLKTKVSKLEQLIGKKEVELAFMKNFLDSWESAPGS